MADAIPPWKRVHPEGLAESILVVTIVFTILSLTVFGLRVWIRLKTRVFGLEDSLMSVGMALNLVHNAFVMYGCYTGIGTPDSKLTLGTMMEGAKTVLLWQLFYVTCSIFIKSSICATLLRIAIQRRHIYVLWGLIFLTVVSNMVAFGAALGRCKPVEASWNPSKGKCLEISIIVTFTYVVSSVNIFTDWSVALIPVFILWKIQMRTKLKFSIAGILGIGVLASAATIIRMPYSGAYKAKVNQLHDIGNIILWTVVECDLGIIAGSLPMLRSMVKSLAKDYSSNSGYQQHNPSGGTGNNGTVITIGRIKTRGTRSRTDDLGYAVDNGTTVVGDTDNNSNEELDSSSTRNIITVTREFVSQSREGKEFELVEVKKAPYDFEYGQSGKGFKR